MGRLRKEIQDKIRQMHREGYTKQEIHEETGCHPETIDKYIEEEPEDEDEETVATGREHTEVERLRDVVQNMKRKQAHLQRCIGNLWTRSMYPPSCPHCGSKAGIRYQHGFRCQSCGKDVFEVGR